MKDWILKISDLSKKFTLDSGLVNAPTFLEIIKSFFGYKVDVSERSLDFWALKNISFELKRGENLGIVGLNGAGKSTLLKIMLNRLTPETGNVDIEGKAGGLIELGAGFHPEQTGRKNIYLNARMLGIPNIEIEEKMGAIIDFAELGDFIDMPVKTYSSGMTIRLGFSVAIHFVRDLIICDEILAVGDFEFKQKCYRKIHELKKDKSFILVSHGTNDIALFCDKALLLHKGEAISFGGVSGVLENYSKASHNLSAEELRRVVSRQRAVSISGNNSSEQQLGSDLISRARFLEDEEVRIKSYGPIYKASNGVRGVRVYSSGDVKDGELHVSPNEPFEIKVEFENQADVASLRVGIPFFSEAGEMIIGPDSRLVDPKSSKCASRGRKVFDFRFKRPPLLHGRYLMALAINNDPGFLFRTHVIWVRFGAVPGKFGKVRVDFSVRLD